MKKKILLIADVKGWGGWDRGKQIEKHLSDEFEFSLITAKEFKDPMYNNGWDLYYPLFHTMVIDRQYQKFMDKGKKVVTIVTGAKAVKKIFKNQRIFNKMLRRCEAVFANSMIGLKSLQDVYKGKTHYVPRGVDETVFYPEPFPSFDKIRISYVGKPVPEKGLHHIIEPACKEANVELVANTNNFTNAVSHDRMREMYNSCHCHMVASISDGTPNPALEAAACGRLIISNRIGNMPEFIKHQTNGFLVDREVGDYVFVLKEIKTMTEYIKQMGANARKTVMKDWSWEQTLKKERKALREVCDGI